VVAVLRAAAAGGRGTGSLKGQVLPLGYICSKKEVEINASKRPTREKVANHNQ